MGMVVSPGNEKNKETEERHLLFGRNRGTFGKGVTTVLKAPNGNYDGFVPGAQLVFTHN